MLEAMLSAVFRKYKIDDFVYPMFYCLPFALRFQTTEENAPTVDRSLFEQSFEVSRLMVVVEGEVEEKLPALFAAGEAEEAVHEAYDPESGESRVYTRHLYLCERKKLDVQAMLNLLISEELYYTRAFIVSPDDGMLMTIYGHQGVDIAAPQSMLLLPLYCQNKPYLSVIDLPQMKLLFDE